MLRSDRFAQTRVTLQGRLRKNATGVKRVRPFAAKRCTADLDAARGRWPAHHRT
jgi:hypothetical protein